MAAAPRAGGGIGRLRAWAASRAQWALFMGLSVAFSVPVVLQLLVKTIIK